MDGGDRTGGQRRQGALGLILEGGRADGTHAVHGSGGRLGGGQAARIAHRDGHGAGEQVAGAQGIGAGDGGNGAGQGLKGTVQRHVRPTEKPAASAAGNSSASVILELSRITATSWPLVTSSPLATFRLLTTPATSARTYWRSTVLS